MLTHPVGPVHASSGALRSRRGELLRRLLAPLKEHRRAYVAMNILYYGLIPLGMGVAVANPELQRAMLEAVGAAFTEGPLAAVGSAYSGGAFWSAVFLTFVINLLLGSFIYITLPSLVLPFSGLLVGCYRALLWGILFAPVALELTIPSIAFGVFTALLLLLEGQAYVLAMLAAYVQSRAFVFPGRAGLNDRREGFRSGVRQSVRLYVLVALVLAVAALYEALIVILPSG